MLWFGTVFFIVSPYILQRMFYHTALSANFLILASLCLWAYRDNYRQRPKRKIVLWTLLLSISTLIHIYYIPMIVIIMLSSFVSEFMEDKKSYKVSIITFIISCVSSILLICIIGASNVNSYYLDGLNIYNANLNTFFNPQGFSTVLQDFEVATCRRI